MTSSALDRSFNTSAQSSRAVFTSLASSCLKLLSNSKIVSKFWLRTWFGPSSPVPINPGVPQRLPYPINESTSLSTSHRCWNCIQGHHWSTIFSRPSLKCHTSIVDWCSFRSNARTTLFDDVINNRTTSWPCPISDSLFGSGLDSTKRVLSCDGCFLGAADFGCSLASKSLSIIINAVLGKWAILIANSLALGPFSIRL